MALVSAPPALVMYGLVALYFALPERTHAVAAPPRARLTVEARTQTVALTPSPMEHH